MQFVECRGVGKIYASKAGPVEALRGIDLAASEGEFVCLLGLSGCGKSTLLQLIAGLEAPTAGSIRSRRHRARWSLGRDQHRVPGPWVVSLDDGRAQY